MGDVYPIEVIPCCDCQCGLCLCMCRDSLVDLLGSVCKTVTRYRSDDKVDSCECCFISKTPHGLYICEVCFIVHPRVKYQLMTSKRHTDEDYHYTDDEFKPPPAQESIPIVEDYLSKV